jgi:arginine repressor
MPTKPRQSQRDKLLRLAEDYDSQAEAAAAPFKQKADALRFAAEALNGHLQAKAQARGVDKHLEAAIALRAQQRTPSKPPPLTVPAATRKSIARRQQLLQRFLKPARDYRTREILAHYAKHGITVDAKTASYDLRHLGARRQGRFSGAYWTLGKPAGRSAEGSKIKQQRARTAAALAQLAKQTEPVSGIDLAKLLPNRGILVAHGYLKKQGAGYLRTEKPFSV